MSKKETKTNAKTSPLANLSEEEIQELQEIYENRKLKFAGDKQKVSGTSQPIYSNITINIGGPNSVDSSTEQAGKPGGPYPPY